MPERTDQFVLTDRPALTLADHNRPLPDCMDHDSCEKCTAQDLDDDAVEATAQMLGPRWRTPKGCTALFRLRGKERDGGRFGLVPAIDRKQVTGAPPVIVGVGRSSVTPACHGRDANGRAFPLCGAATRFWAAHGA
ncbi:hypothetical protein [Streptomyces sp. NPDC059631]|uniref:hypothetical protein n=1 Tax=unclassified Streptomyces TaxID=2593676 RepID=UPI0036863F05